ncbi:MAG: hypothetical protein WBX38_06685 [Candidatus Sulfotelmatobacter sp.]
MTKSEGDVATPQIRIFPHSQAEFPSKELLMMWLVIGLRGRGGAYHLTSADAVADLSPGSLVLFRYGHEIIGEAVVCKGKELGGAKGRSLLGEEGSYAAQVTFAPSSIRLYSPPLPVKQIQQYTEKDISSSAQPYYKLDWEIYGFILREVISRRNQSMCTEGTFIGS